MSLAACHQTLKFIGRDVISTPGDERGISVAELRSRNDRQVSISALQSVESGLRNSTAFECQKPVAITMPYSKFARALHRRRFEGSPTWIFHPQFTLPAP